MLEKPQNDIVVVAEVAGEMQAEMLRSLLEAHGVSAILSEESTARTIGISMPGLGLVQVLVRADQAEAARKILEDYEQGNLVNDGDDLQEAPDEG
ncbi:MAG: putative signal transducing protein [Chloroflexota bacterium]